MPTGSARVAFRGVWKKFRRGELHDSLRDLIPAMVKRLTRRDRRRDELGAGDFWALQDVSFEVRPGQSLGIIGANGAGKSTALKILTRILRPTRGASLVSGRIGALIEVSAGFHPDLTGRENVALQGAIMGMRARDIKARFDEIVAFSGIEEFIDTPVKRYSSGMNARLGFSIAAHLEPDVLIIDEVLSVGDYAFQRRAFGRIAQLARSGIPVIVVSHQLDRIAELCTEAILLERGRLVKRGVPADCIAVYVMGQAQVQDSGSDECPVRIDSVDSESGDHVTSGRTLMLRVSGHIVRELREPLEHVGVRVRALNTGQFLFASNSTHCHVHMPSLGPFTVAIELQLNVPAGNYLIETAVWDPRLHRDAFAGPVLRLTVDEGPAFAGSVQMNPRMRLVAPAALDGRSGHSVSR